MTKFRACIDIHSGQVKQIVGGTLTEDDSKSSMLPVENFISSKPASYYARLYKSDLLYGCHVIKLGSNPSNDDAAKLACATWPYHLQVGGGINDTNALKWLDDYKASHVIITSWLFTDIDGEYQFNWQRLRAISRLTGPKRLVVDLSCRKVVADDDFYWVVTINKWQTLTGAKLNPDFLRKVSQYCDEVLVHAADVEGLCKGIDQELVAKLGEWCPEGFDGKIVYAGGASLVMDLDLVHRLSFGKVDLTFGSALDIFGGSLVKYDDVVAWNKRHEI